MIPRNIYFFWSGRSMSWLRYMTVRSFVHYNPTWNVTVFHMPAESGATWKTREKDDAEYSGKDYFPDLNNLNVEITEWIPPMPGLHPAHASGLLEWAILTTKGGWCADMDILFVSPMDAVYENCKDDDVVFCLSYGYMANGFMAASPGCTLMRDLWKTALDNYDPNDYQCVGPNAMDRFGGLEKSRPAYPGRGKGEMVVIRNKYPDVRIKELPGTTVYPWEWNNVSAIFDKVSEIPGETIGIHWFGGSPDSQKWNLILTEDNYKDHNSTLTRYIRPVFQQQYSTAEFQHMMEL